MSGEGVREKSTSSLVNGRFEKEDEPLGFKNHNDLKDDCVSTEDMLERAASASEKDQVENGRKRIKHQK